MFQRHSVQASIEAFSMLAYVRRRARDTGQMPQGQSVSIRTCCMTASTRFLRGVPLRCRPAVASALDSISLVYLDDPPATKAGHPQKVVCNRGKAAGPIDGVQSPKAAEH
jgi:hypothetical protein